jgi:hypothetical protein
MKELYLCPLRLLQREEKSLGYRQLIKRLSRSDGIRATPSKTPKGSLEYTSTETQNICTKICIYLQQAQRRTLQHTIRIVDNYCHQLAKSINQSANHIITNQPLPKHAIRINNKTHLHSPSASHSQSTSHYSQFPRIAHRPFPA